MENIFFNYTKPSQLDLKLGISLEPNSEELYSNYGARQLVDRLTPTQSHGARLGGYNLFDFKTNVSHECCDPDWWDVSSWSEAVEPMQSLKSVFSKCFIEMHQSGDVNMLSFFGSRLQEMFLWWNETGRDQLRVVSSSLLFTYEGVEDTGHKKYNLKIIDFAHAYNASSRSDWDDKVVLGLTSVMRRVDKTLHTSPPMLQYNEVCSGWNCRTPCPKPEDHSESKSAEGVLLPRCESLAKSLNFTYFSWEDRDPQQEIQCLLCNKLQDATSHRRRRYHQPWEAGLRVYERPTL